jgi:hypothetical protein
MAASGPPHLIPGQIARADPQAQAVNQNTEQVWQLNQAASQAGSGDSGKLFVNLDALQQLGTGIQTILSNYFDTSSSPAASSNLQSGMTLQGSALGANFDEANTLFNAYTAWGQQLLRLHADVNNLINDLSKDVVKAHSMYSNSDLDAENHVKRQQQNLNGMNATIAVGGSSASNLGNTFGNTSGNDNSGSGN